MQTLKLKLNTFISENLKDKFASDGSGWLMLQQIVIAPMSLFTTVLLAKILSIDDYGFYKYILSMYGIIALTSMVGFISVAGLNVQRGQDEFFDIGFNYRKILRWIPAAISLFIAIYYFYNQNYFLGSLFLITIFSHLFVDTYVFYSAGLWGRGAFKTSAIFEIVNYFVSYFPPILVAYIFRYDVNVVIMVFMTMFLCQFVFRYYAFRYVKSKFKFENNKVSDKLDKIDHKNYKKESIESSLNYGISGVSGQISGVIVFNRLGAADNAVYSLAMTFSDFASTIIASTLNKVVLVLSRMTKENKNKDKILYVKSLYKKYFIFAFFVTLFTMLALPFVYEYLFAKYLFSYQYAVVYSISILSVAFLPAQQYFLEKRYFRFLNFIQIIALALNIVSLFLAATFFGVWGAVIVAVIMKFVNNGVCAAFLYNKD